MSNKPSPDWGRVSLEVLSGSLRGIRRAAQIVKDGGLVAFPTDTVYGLGCDPHNVRALRRLFSAKGKRGKPVPVLVSSLKVAQRIAVMDERARAMASRFWPGPLTIVAKSRVRFPNLVTMRRKTIAVRCPGNRVALELIRRCGGSLTGTSANVTGRPPCRSVDAVRRALGDNIDAVVDAGPSPRRAASTIVRVHPKGVSILRRGPIKDPQIRQVLSRVEEQQERKPRNNDEP